MIEGSGSGSGSETKRPKNIRITDPDSDPDPQHWFVAKVVDKWKTDTRISQNSTGKGGLQSRIGRKQGQEQF
jgi:hypothetical protein